MNDNYVEDIFVKFFQDSDSWKKLTDQNDYSAAHSFYGILLDNRALTKNQSNYVLKILKNNKDWFNRSGLDSDKLLSNPQWKNNFRVIDTSKRLSVAVDNDGRLVYEFKFPYSLKETFEKEMFSTKKQSMHSTWDYDNRVRKLPFYEHDIIKVLDFAKKHNFEIDSEVFNLEDQIEAIWNQYDNIVSMSVIEDNQIVLKNAEENSINYWNQHKSDYNNDLLLAKHMGYLLNCDHLKTDIEVIASKTSNSFWMKDLNRFFNLYKQLNTKVCILINNDSKEWLSNFVNCADSLQIPRSDIKVCFREKKESTSGFNQWIKDNNLGGSVSEGRIFIFNNSPAKWLYKDLESFKIIATNMIIPPMSQNTKVLLESHPCVIYLGDIKPTKMREMDLVNL